MSTPPAPPSAALPPPPGALPEEARTLLRRGRAGAGTILLVTGGERASRTGALQALTLEAERRGWQVLSATAFSADRETPYAALEDLLPKLRPAVPPSRVPAPLASLFSVPTRGARPSRRSEREEGDEAPFGLPPGIRPGEVLFRSEEVVAELTELLLPSVGASPRLLTLADGEHLDRASREFLVSLAPRLEQSPLGVAVSLDDDAKVREEWQRALQETAAVWTRLASPRSVRSPGAPATLRGLGRLSPGAVSAAAAATLAGPEATLSFLPVALERPASDLGPALDEGVAAGVLWKEGHRYHPADASHAEAILQAAGPAEVARLHAALARALKRTHPVLHGNVLFRLADHWARSGNAHEAVPALLAAAGEARRRGAVDSAETEVRRAVLLAQREASPEFRRWEEQAHAALGGVLASEGAIREAFEEYERALKLARSRSGGIASWGPHEERLLWLGVASATGEDLEGRLQALIEASRRAKQVGLEANALSSLVHYYGTRGSADEALELAPKAVRAAEAAGDLGGLVRALRMEALANLGGSPPSLEACVRPLRRAVELARQMRDFGAEAYAFDNWAICEWSLGDRKEAVRLEEHGLVVARKSGSRFAVLSVMSNLVEYLVEIGQLRRAEEVLAEARHEIDRLHLPPAHAIATQTQLGEARLRSSRGDLPGARTLFLDLAERVERSQDLELLAQALLHLADVQLRMGDRADARKTLHRLEVEGLRRRVPANCRELQERLKRELGPG